jgi:hypothetical protein
VSSLCSHAMLFCLTFSPKSTEPRTMIWNCKQNKFFLS